MHPNPRMHQHLSHPLPLPKIFFSVELIDTADDEIISKKIDLSEINYLVNEDFFETINDLNFATVLCMKAEARLSETLLNRLLELKL